MITAANTHATMATASLVEGHRSRCAGRAHLHPSLSKTVTSRPHADMSEPESARYSSVAYSSSAHDSLSLPLALPLS